MLKKCTASHPITAMKRKSTFSQYVLLQKIYPSQGKGMTHGVASTQGKEN